MNDKEIIERTREFVQHRLKGAEGGHDWFHIERVYRTAVKIAAAENVNSLVVALGALLHDIADSKFHGGNEEIGPELAADFLDSIGLDTAVRDHVITIIKEISFKNTLTGQMPNEKSPELMVVQDADRLDAIGAIGIARAFNFGGFKNRPLFDPSVAPNLNMTKQEYKKAENPTINHFYEKLLLLKDQMNTKTAKAMAEDRHKFMLEYLEQFSREWEGES